jgi:hypothetical protein
MGVHKRRGRRVCCVEGAVKGVLNSNMPDKDVLWKNGDELKRRTLEDAAQTKYRWPRMSYTDAIAELVIRETLSPA